MKFIFKITDIFLLLYTVTMHVSECYHYHTPTFYKLFVDNKQLLFQHTVKYPNYVSCIS
ncbi:hypothetical protein [Winogradskyella wichelsiae]|uniref:hypothetical protein n=1 Tax=Winogradskyella wichelsiae TaxID=2697007 RepID=UPI003EF1C2AC